MANACFTLEDGLNMAYRDLPAQNSEDRPAVLCLHGLTRQSGDFETVFDWLSTEHRVIAPDFRGRGKSDADSHLHRYNPRQYADDVLALLDHIGVLRVAIIGTSLGGWVAACLAARRPGLIVAAVLNDIGPTIPDAAATRVEAGAGTLQPVRNWSEAIDATRAHYQHALPDLGDEQWAWYASQTFHQVGPDRIELICDRGVGEAARAGLSRLDADPWAMFDALCAVPTLVIHGALSAILDAPTLKAMHDRYAALQSVTLPNRGHVPLLDEPEAHRALSSFFQRLADRKSDFRHAARVQ